MTDDERHLLNEALGRADTAMTMMRLLLLLLGGTRVIEPDHILDALDVSLATVEQALSTPSASSATAVQARELRSLINLMDTFPVFKEVRERRRS